MTDYVPIACARHEALELAVLRRQKLRVELLDELGACRALLILPTDVYTRDGAEWLRFRSGEGEGVVRLDRVLGFSPA